MVLPASFIQYHFWTPPTWPHHSPSPVISVHQEDSSTTLILLYFTRQQQSQSCCTRFPFHCAHWRLLPPPLNLAQLFCKNTMNLPALSSKLCQNNKRMRFLSFWFCLLFFFFADSKTVNAAHTTILTWYMHISMHYFDIKYAIFWEMKSYSPTLLYLCTATVCIIVHH